jgi:hypothetical protein
MVVDAGLKVAEDADLHGAALVVVLARDQPNHLLTTRSTASRRDVTHTVHDRGLRLVYSLVAASAQGVCRPAADRAQTTPVEHRASQPPLSACALHL